MTATAPVSVTRDRSARGLGALATAFLVSQLGEAMVLVALPWFVLQTTGSVTSMGLVAAIATVSSAVAGLLAGPATDRLGLKRALVCAYLVGGLSMAAIPLVYALGSRELWPILVLTAGASAFDAPAGAAVVGLIGHLARARNVRLEAANSLFQGIGHLVFLVGPGIAGIVVAVVGPAWLLILDAVACVFGAVLVAGGVRGVPSGRGAGSGDAPASAQPARTSSWQALRRFGGRYARDLADGLALIWRDGLLRALTVTTTVLGALDAAVVGVVLVAYGKDVLGGAAGFGGMVTAYSLGALGGAALYGAIGHRLSRRRVYLGGGLAIGVVYGLLAMTPPPVAVFGAIALAGVAAAPLDAVRSAAVQERVPASLFGRVIGARSTLSAASAPAAIALLAAVVPAVGVSTTLAAVAGVYVLMIGLYARSRSLWSLDHPATN